MDFLEIGKIVKTHGLKGCVKVLSYLESDALLKKTAEIFIGQSPNVHQSYEIKSLQVKGRCFYLTLQGIETVEKAESLVGCHIWTSATLLEKLPEDEFYWQELIGLEVLTEEGDRVGKVDSIFPTGSNDVYVCSCDGQEILLPAIEQVIKEIDLPRRRIVVRLPEEA